MNPSNQGGKEKTKDTNAPRFIMPQDMDKNNENN